MNIIKLNEEQTIKTTELLELINNARKGFGESAVANRHFISRVEDELEGEISLRKTFTHPSNGAEIVYYELSMKQAMLVGMRESKAVRRSVVKTLEDMQTTIESQRKQISEIEAQLLLADYAARMLRLPESGKLSMLQTIASNNSIAGNFLPSYGVDASTSNTTGSSMPTASATALLKERNSGLSANAFNKLLSAEGLLERLERPSSTKGSKPYWSVTEEGLEYGKNIISPNNPRETFPHWYVDKFDELLERVEN